MKILFYVKMNQLIPIEHLQNFLTTQNFNFSGGTVD